MVGLGLAQQDFLQARVIRGEVSEMMSLDGGIRVALLMSRRMAEQLAVGAPQARAACQLLARLLKDDSFSSLGYVHTEVFVSVAPPGEFPEASAEARDLHARLRAWSLVFQRNMNTECGLCQDKRPLETIMGDSPSRECYADPAAYDDVLEA